MTIETFTTGDGCRLAWRLEGPRQAPILLLSNSLGTTMEMWAPQMDALTVRLRVLRYDTRGHGRSDAPPGAYGLDRLGRDVIELLDALGLPRVNFCGLSMGGMIGQWLGIHAPERLDRLILANTSADMGPPSSWDARISLVREKGMAALTEAVLERWFTKNMLDARDPGIETVRAMLLATDPQGYAGCCAAIRDMDLRRLGSQVPVPTLIVAGTADPATPPEHSQALAEAIPNARLRFLDAAHLSNWERPREFSDEVLRFL